MTHPRGASKETGQRCWSKSIRVGLRQLSKFCQTSQSAAGWRLWQGTSRHGSPLSVDKAIYNMGICYLVSESTYTSPISRIVHRIFNNPTVHQRHNDFRAECPF